jgi:hypothetical protein
VAYSLNDLYRPLRTVMRVDGLLLGLGFGGLLLLAPAWLLALWGDAATGALWPARMAGGLFVALGVLLILGAQERIVSSAIMLCMVVANAATALVLLWAYLQQEFAGIGWAGQALLVLVFLLCLVSAVLPLRFLRADYGIL